MKSKFTTILVSGIGVIAGYILAHPLSFGICNRIYTFNNTRGCLDNSIWSVGEPLFIFAVVIFVLAVLLAVFGDRIYISWLRFAAWWIPLSVIFIAVTPSTSNSWMPLFFIGKDTVTIVMAGIFTLISLILIAVKTLAARKAQ